MKQGEPPDARFDPLTQLLPGEFAYYVEPPTPTGIYRDFGRVYQALRRLKLRGLKPDFVIDIEASTGVWSADINQLFPAARFILIDPVASKYSKESLKHLIDKHPNFEVLEVAVADQPGRILFKLTPNLFSSSLLTLDPQFMQVAEEVEVEVTTLDALAKQHVIQGRGIVKMDVQCAEHLILEGGKEFLRKQVDAIVIELSLHRFSPDSKMFLEMLMLMDAMGFLYLEDVGEWRSPVDGTLQQKDSLFVRHEFYKNYGTPSAAGN